jgi:hypothetical protein
VARGIFLKQDEGRKASLQRHHHTKLEGQFLSANWKPSWVMKKEKRREEGGFWEEVRETPAII